MEYQIAKRTLAYLCLHKGFKGCWHSITGHVASHLSVMSTSKYTTLSGFYMIGEGYVGFSLHCMFIIII